MSDDVDLHLPDRGPGYWFDSPGGRRLMMARAWTSIVGFVAIVVGVRQGVEDGAFEGLVFGCSVAGLPVSIPLVVLVLWAGASFSVTGTAEATLWVCQSVLCLAFYVGLVVWFWHRPSRTTGGRSRHR